MSLKNSFGVNKNAANTGVWVTADVDENGKEMRFKVKPMHSANKELQRVQASISKPYRRQIANGTLQAKLAEKIARDVFIEACLVDWENVIVDVGAQPLEFTPENAEKLLIELPSLLEFLTINAQDLSNFQDNIDAAKN